MSKDGKLIRQLRKNYSYDCRQLERDFAIHPQTLRKWVKDFDLPLIQRKPLVIFSEVLREFFKERLQSRKTKLEFQEQYCMPCKAPRIPLEEKAHFEVLKNTVALRSICPVCGAMMRRIYSKDKMDVIQPFLKRITLEELNILGNANSKQMTHLDNNSTSHPNEPTTDIHLQTQIALL